MIQQEVKIYKDDAIKDGLNDAKGEVKKYIYDSEITDSGIFVHRKTNSPVADSQGNYTTAAYGVHIDEDVKIIQRGNEVAKYGATTQVGMDSQWHVSISGNAIQFVPPVNSGEETITIGLADIGTAIQFIRKSTGHYLYDTYLCNGELYILSDDTDHNLSDYASLTVGGLVFADEISGKHVQYGLTDTLEISQYDFSSDFRLYDANSPVMLRRCGNVVTMTGVVQPTSQTALGKVDHRIFTIPTRVISFSPPQEIVQIMQGGEFYHWCIKVKTNGDVTFSRFSASDYAACPTNGWLPFHVTWILD